MQRPPASAASPDDAVEFRAYVDVLRRRWRFVAICTLLGLGLAILYSFSRTPTYTAASQVLVRPPSSSDAYRPDQLVSLDTEARLVRSEPIAEIAKEKLGSPLTIPDLLEHVSVATTAETLVLDISFWAGNPGGAAAGADAFARSYLEYKEEKARDSLLEQRDALQTLIDEAASERDRQNRILEGAIPGSVEFRNAQAQRDTLNGQIAILTAQLAQVPVTVDPGEVILPASPPSSPSSPNHKVNLALGAFLGLFLGIVGAFVRDRMDDRVRDRSDVEAVIDAPVLATIPRVHGWHRHGPVWLETETAPTSPGAESYRTLRTSVMAMGRQRAMTVIAIVGATLGEGKTATTANLAAALAQADNRVLALSADLRKPRLHEFFDLDNGVGLSDVLLGEASLADVIHAHTPNLSVISSGTVPARPAELLGSDAMAEILHDLRGQFDFVLIDTPPVLGLADTLAVAALVDGVLLVAHADTSRQGALLHAAEQLAQVGVRINGTVLTNVPIGRHSAYQYGYGYAYGEERMRQSTQTRVKAQLSRVSSPRPSRPPASTPPDTRRPLDPGAEGRAATAPKGSKGQRPRSIGKEAAGLDDDGMVERPEVAGGSSPS